MDFIIGCNYWSSHAGTDMWTNWDEKTVKDDLRVLSECGVKYLRVFPLWDTFQPIKPYYVGSKFLGEYRMCDGSMPNNPYYIDETMVERFVTLCRIADEYGIKLIVGILTGWMSGRLFIPPALYNLDIYTDPTALMLTRKFVHGFVEMTKNESAIHSWDLGNECNCMGEIPSRDSAYTWSAMVSDAIRGADNTRPVISGMHSLRIDNKWTIKDQGELTDVLTTHPYNYWVEHARVDRSISLRSLLAATAESDLYRDIGGKPVLIEEIGTMGPEVCSDDAAGIFMRCQLFSAWANDHIGLLWWCAFDQNKLEAPPYEWNMIERYLGLLRSDKSRKPAAQAMSEFSSVLSSLNIQLPKKEIDAVCILSKDIDHWAIAYMSYVLAKQMGLSLRFAYSEDDLPDSDLYLLPSINGARVMSKHRYEELKSKVNKGAKLYISNQTGIITEFEELIGAKIIDSSDGGKTVKFKIDKNTETISYLTDRELSLTTAKAVIRDETGAPLYLKNDYGKGEVYYFNAPLEASLVNKANAFESKFYLIYDEFAHEILNKKPLVSKNPEIAITYHVEGNVTYAVLINYSDKIQDAEISVKGKKTFDILYGTPENISAGDACILKII